MSTIKNYIVLPNGDKMPVVGLGTWGLVDKELVIVLHEAFRVGYRNVDTSYMNGNEKTVGAVVREWLEAKKLKRKNIFITGKLPPTGMQADKVKHFCQLSLKNLSLTFIDLYLIHLPVGIKYKNDEEIFPCNPDGTIATEYGTDLTEIWKEMENLVKEGLVRNIGVSNFNQEQLERLLQTAIIKPANLQVEIHAYFQQRDLCKFCRENGISVTGYCPLGSPNREPMLFSRANSKIMSLLSDPVVTEIAEKCEKSPAQILLRHAVQKYIAVLPKATARTRLEENFEIFSFYLTRSEMKQLNALDQGQLGRTFDYSFLGESFLFHPHFPFDLKFEESIPQHH